MLAAYSILSYIGVLSLFTLFVMTDLKELFLKPTSTAHIRYEVLRAYFVEGLSYEAIADRFGYTRGHVANLVSKLRTSPVIDHFRDAVPTPKPKPKRPSKADRDARILALRNEEQLTNQEIHRRLKEESIPAGINTIGRVIRDAGLPRLRRRFYSRDPRPIPAAPADVRQFKAGTGTFQTRFGGLFLFARDMVDTDLTAAVAHMPGSERLPAACMIRALLALKLWGIERPSHVMPYILDAGLSFFAGLNEMPKKSTLTEYSTRVDATHLDRLMDTWYARSQPRMMASDGSMDLDFHTIPYHGHLAPLQSHDVSKRSRRQRGILALVARDAHQRALVFADATITRETSKDAVLTFVENWHKRTGQNPAELVFDSRFTTYANLGKLNDRGIRFLTVRRRFPGLVRQAQAQPAEAWQTVRLHNIGRAYRRPRVMEETVQLRHCSCPLRQLSILGLGRDKPTFLITNDTITRKGELIDRYARRMLIENAIEESVNFFHMDALSAAVPLRIDVDLQLTLIGSALYRMLAKRLGPAYTKCKAKKIFRLFVNAPAEVKTTPENITVRFTRRAHNNTLRQAGYIGTQGIIPWLHNRELILDYV